MKKTFFIVVAAILALCFASCVLAAPGDSASDPIFVETADELDNVRLGLNKHYKLSNDIDLTSYLSQGGAGYAKWGSAGWAPIGHYSGNNTTHFSGSFNGGGYVIKGLWIDQSASQISYVGLFGIINGAAIENLGVEIAAAGIKGVIAGGLAGQQIGVIIDNCHAKGNVTVTGDGGGGGLVGHQEGAQNNSSIIENSYAEGNVSVIETNDNLHNPIGGLVGIQREGAIANCYATGNISGNDFVGGLVGEQSSSSGKNSSIENSYAAGNVTALGNFSGGLVGGQSSTGNGISNIEHSHATGNVNGVNVVGGLVGEQYVSNAGTNKIINCYAINNVVSGDSTVGGLAGWQYSFGGANNIENSYAKGNITATIGNAGGLLGEQYTGRGGDSIVKNCYATGNIVARGNYVGGLIGTQNTFGNDLPSSSNSIQFSYATGNATTTASTAGGLVGFQYADGYNSNNIVCSYAIGNVSATTDTVGGLAGWQYSIGINSNNSIRASYRYQLATVNGVVRTENTPNSRHGGIKTAAELTTKSTYTDNSWLFNDSPLTAGPWYWDSGNYPKLNMGAEEFPFPFEPQVIPVTGVTVAPKTLTLTVGENHTLVATVAPSDATNKNVSWSSNNTSVATVNASGVVTAAAAGTATITVTTVDGDRTDTCEVTVTSGTDLTTGIILDKSFFSIHIGSTGKLTETVLPASAANKNVTWSSDNQWVATVDANGLVTAIGAGSAIITVRAVDGGFTATCTVSVTTPASRVTIIPSSININSGTQYYLDVLVEPFNVSYSGVTWSSSNTSVATVNQGGWVTAVGSGNATITATAADGTGISDTCSVTVTP